jgi:hypothetical protein
MPIGLPSSWPADDGEGLSADLVDGRDVIVLIEVDFVDFAARPEASISMV